MCFTTHPSLSSVALDSPSIPLDAALKQRGGFNALPFLPGVVLPCRSLFVELRSLGKYDGRRLRQTMSDSANSSRVASAFGRRKSRVDKRRQGQSPMNWERIAPSSEHPRRSNVRTCSAWQKSRTRITSSLTRITSTIPWKFR